MDTKECFWAKCSDRERCEAFGECVASFQNRNKEAMALKRTSEWVSVDTPPDTDDPVLIQVVEFHDGGESYYYDVISGSDVEDYPRCVLWQPIQPSEDTNGQ